jgi:hypothetical protein
MAEITMSTGGKPFMSIETKGEKKMDKMIKYISDDFLGNKNQKLARNVSSKLKTKMQLAFLGSNVRTEVTGADFRMSVTNISQLNEVLGKKAAIDVSKQIEVLYQEEFEKAKEVK